MFVIKNTKRDYNCYLSNDNKWEGLLKSKTFETKEEAEKTALPSDEGDIISWDQAVGIYREDLQKN